MARVTAFMATLADYVRANGQRALRKRRRDSRCLVAGVCSWPVEMAHLRHLARNDKSAYDRETQRMFDWMKRTQQWLRSEWRQNLVETVVHLDESHPHRHFFLAGDARRLHPGLAAKMQDGQRIESRREKIACYRAAMARLLDDYHTEVGAPCGLSRSLEGPPRPRIKDRALAARVLELERLIGERPDPQLPQLLEGIFRDAPKVVRDWMRF